MTGDDRRSAQPGSDSTDRWPLHFDERVTVPERAHTPPVMDRRIEVRPLRPDEREVWEPLWSGYLTFYEAVLGPDVTDTTWRRLHDPTEPMHVLGALLDGRLVGIVHYLFHRSTWTVGDYCYLQDLYTEPDARGLGAGRALIEAVTERARAAGASRVYWLTHESNATARALYDRVADRPGFIQYRRVL
jgi:GNAT superfamily N-acetyltransferase